MLLDTYAALKRINKYKLKFKSKAWITLGLQKINIFKKQNILGEIGKYYEHMERNQIPYFSKNCSIQSSTGLSLDNDDTIFASIAKTTKKKKKKKKIHKHFSDCLSNEPSSTIFLQPTDKEEIASYPVSSNKASSPSSIPYRILFLLINEILKQLADLFNLSFMTGVFLLHSKLQK